MFIHQTLYLVTHLSCPINNFFNLRQYSLVMRACLTQGSLWDKPLAKPNSNKTFTSKKYISIQMESPNLEKAMVDREAAR